MVNPNPRYRKNIKPGLQVPAGLEPELDKFLTAIKEHLQGADGTRGQPQERFVTLEDLESVGLIKTGVKNGRGVITRLNSLTGATDFTALAALALDNLIDVETGGVLDDYFLQYDATTSRWVAISPTQTTAALDEFDGGVKGLVPESPGGDVLFLREDGTWAEGGGTGGGALVYVNTTVPGGNTVANTTTETAFSSSYDIPGDSLAVGDVVRVRLAGVGNADAGSVDFRLRIKLDGATILDTGEITKTGGETDAGWWLEAQFVVHSIGATGTVDAQGYAHLGDTHGPMPRTAVATVDTTQDLSLTVTADWSVADTDNSVTLREMSVYLDGVSTAALTEAATFLTEDDESAVLPNSRQLLPGTNVDFDVSVASEFTVNVLPIHQKGACWSTTDTGEEIDEAIAPEVTIQVPIKGTIVGVTVTTTGGSGSCVIDIEKSTYSGFPTTTTITAAAKPTISSGTKYNDTTLTGWTTAIAAGDVLRFQLESSSVFTSITVVLKIQETV